MALFSALALVIALAASAACAAGLAWAVSGSVRLGRAKTLARLGEAAEQVLIRARGLAPVRRALAKKRQAQREALIARQMPEALRLLCIALEAGSSLEKALEYVAENTAAPLSEELERAVWDLQVGQGFDEAMEHLRARTGSPEFSYLAVAMEVQHRSGGSLAEVLESIAASLRDSAELAESLRTQTAQGRLSVRVVSAVPLAIVVVFSILTPSYLADFVSTPLGVFLLVFAALLEACGLLWVRRVLSIDLSSRKGGERA